MKRWRASEHLAKGILALFAVVVVATAAMAWRNTERLQANDGAVTHGWQVLDATERLLSTLKDVETGQRGYLLTESPTFLAPYEPEEGTLWLTVGTCGPGDDAGTDDHRVEIRVRDTGVGIAPEMLPRVFDLFMPAPSASRQPRGLGIGLALVKRLVELHGGAVVASSQGLGKGSEFVVTLACCR